MAFQQRSLTSGDYLVRMPFQLAPSRDAHLCVLTLNLSILVWDLAGHGISLC